MSKLGISAVTYRLNRKRCFRYTARVLETVYKRNGDPMDEHVANLIAELKRRGRMVRSLQDDDPTLNTLSRAVKGL